MNTISKDNEKKIVDAATGNLKEKPTNATFELCPRLCLNGIVLYPTLTAAFKVQTNTKRTHPSMTGGTVFTVYQNDENPEKFWIQREGYPLGKKIVGYVLIGCPDNPASLIFPKEKGA